jgi:hypothetical protein
MRRRLRAAAFGVALLLTLVLPTTASAQLTSIAGSPLSVYTDGLGGVQIMVEGNDAGVFYNPFSVGLGTAPHAGLEAVVDGTAFQLGVYRVQTVPTQVVDLGSGNRVLQSEYDLQVTGTPPTLHVKELLTNVNGSPVVGVQYEVTNVSGAPAGVRVGMLGDLYSGGNDVGTGQLINQGGARIVVGTSASTGAQSGVMEIDPPWSAYQEGLYSNVFASFTGAGLNDTVDPNAVDNAVGAQWDLGTMQPGASEVVATGWLVQGGQGGLTPDLGKTVLATTSKGKVRVKLPGSNRFVDLTSLRELPLGTIFDTTKGQVTLTSAANAKGTTQKAWFYEGIFKIGQTRGAKPITTLAMAGDKPSCATPKRSRASKKATSRRLWGDGKGRFQTKGQFSSATVRGTKWLVEDRCDGTLTKVVRGVVTVRDFVKRKTVTVKAGDTYLARKAG